MMPPLAMRTGGRPRAQGGFTLIEILFAMTIFMSGVAGVYALLSTSLGMQRESLELSRATRASEGIVQRLEREISQGLHFDRQQRTWTDIVLAQDGDGTYYSVAFVPETDNEAEGTLLAVVRIARRERDVPTARPVSHVLSPGPTFAEAVRIARGAPSP